MSKTVLELKNIIKSYNDGASKREVLSGINVTVNEGELIGIVGPSGSGKSTLLSITGLLLTQDGGDVIINGIDMTSKKQKEKTALRKEHIGFIFQNHQLLPFLKVKDQLLEFQSKKNSEIINAENLLKELGLEQVLNSYPSKLSGGEKQRVAIARAFINNPDLILADEPTASLDAQRGRQVVEMIRKQVKKYNKAGIMVTHDERVLELMDRVYLLENGSLLEKRK